jgi:hypothetical protein
MFSVINLILIYERKLENIRYIFILYASLNHSKSLSDSSLKAHLMYETVYKLL